MWKSNQFDEKKCFKGKNNQFLFPPINAFFRQITQSLEHGIAYDPETLCMRETRLGKKLN